MKQYLLSVCQPDGRPTPSVKPSVNLVREDAVRDDRLHGPPRPQALADA